MAFCDKLAAGIPTLSYEFSPPKNPAGWATLYSTLGEISRHSPDFVSVTYGAGGSNRQKTVDLVSRIERELDIESVPHLTCVGHSQEEIREILTTLQSAGIHHLMALRGDAPKHDPQYHPHPDGFIHASDLIQFVKANFDFHIGCAFYPEKHPDAPHLDEDLRWLKHKQDCGAEFATSQLFFDNDVFFEFRDKAARDGITFPLIAGILPCHIPEPDSAHRGTERTGRFPKNFWIFWGRERKKKFWSGALRIRNYSVPRAFAKWGCGYSPVYI